MSLSLYRRYRPQKFSEVVSQCAAVELLTRSVELGRTAHAYLFSGPRGCGKTTVARVLAKAVNCLEREGAEPCCRCRNCSAITAGESLDVIEIDGASNNGVDEVRELKTHVGLVPFASRYKVYIIDEVHMLSTSAFNALLKTLEEPPAYVIFILATTEAHKVPVTIRSRCQHIPFHSIGVGQIFEHLERVCATEGAAAQREALWELARQADGALRDALSLLEQVLNRKEGELTLSGVEAALGEGSRPALERWLARWRSPDAELFSDLHRMLLGGASPQRFVEELFSLVRNLWLTARWSGVLAALDASEQEKEFLKAQAPLWAPSLLQRMMAFLAGLLPQVRQGLRADVLAGLLMLEISRLGEPKPAEETPPGAIPVPSKGEAIDPALFEPPEAKRERAPGEGPRKTSTATRKDPVPAPAPSPSPLPGADWAPLGEAEREELLDRLHEGDFLLYCALLDAAPLSAKDEKDDDILLWDFSGASSSRYCYEVLSLSRHRSALGAFSPQFKGGVFLRCGKEAIPCLSLERTQPLEARRATGEAPSRAGEALPDEVLSKDEDEGRARSDGEKKLEAEGALPFGGLLRDVSRLMNGELILVRSGAEDGAEEGALSAEKDEND